MGKIVAQRLDKEAGSQRGFNSVRKHQVQKNLGELQAGRLHTGKPKSKRLEKGLVASKKASVLLPET